MRVGRGRRESVVARIVAMVEEASETKARTQLFIEKVEQRYSIGMVTATVLLFAVPLLAGAAFQPTLLRAMTFMIVASPCAVVLATMPPLLASMANAGRHGVLVKSAVVMEQLGATTRVAFDKTGTLTEGTPRDWPRSAAARRRSWANGRCSRWRPPPRIPSEHPLGRAVVAAAREAGLRARGAPRSSPRCPAAACGARVSGRLVEIGSPARLLGPDADRRSRRRSRTWRRAGRPPPSSASTARRPRCSASPTRYARPPAEPSPASPPLPAARRCC